MENVSPRTSLSTPAMAEDVVVSISHQVGDFAVTFGGETTTELRCDGWLEIGRYAPQNGEPGEGQIIPVEVRNGLAEFGVLTTDQLRDLALALTRAADRFDAIRASVLSPAGPAVTPIETRRRRRA